MRAIDYDPSKLALPADWAARAAKLTQQLVDAADAAARKKILKTNGIWSEIASELRKLSNGNCWYTESPQAGTDVDVDHFRPKNRVAERLGGDDDRSAELSTAPAAAVPFSLAS